MQVRHKTADYTCRPKYIHYIQTIKTRRTRGKTAAESQICFLVSEDKGEDDVEEEVKETSA